MSNWVLSFTEVVMLTIILFLCDQKSIALHRHCLSIHDLPWQPILTPLTRLVSSFIPFLPFWTYYALLPLVPCFLSTSLPCKRVHRFKKNKWTKPNKPKSFSVLLPPPFHSPLQNKATQNSQKCGFPRNIQQIVLNRDSFHHSYTHKDI